MLKLTFASAYIWMALLVTAFAQAPRGNSTGPYDPNQPMNAPDLQAPSPCAPDSSVAHNSGAGSPPALTQKDSALASSADTQCAGRALPSGPSDVTVEPVPPVK